MNTQRKVVITTTYNEMGIIIDTKAEEIAQPDTTTHDSIPAETGKNDEDRTSGDCISRQQAIDEIHEDADWLASQGSDWQGERMERDKSILMSLPSVQPETNCSEFPNNWIPCSERMPEEEYVLISKKPTKISGDKWSVAIAIRMADPRSRKIQWRDSGFGIIPDDKVLA